MHGWMEDCDAGAAKRKALTQSRTTDLVITNDVLYPTELLGQLMKLVRTLTI